MKVGRRNKVSKDWDEPVDTTEQMHPIDPHSPKEKNESPNSGRAENRLKPVIVYSQYDSRFFHVKVKVTYFNDLRWYCLIFNGCRHSTMIIISELLDAVANEQKRGD
jgi:hypothetical protein